MGSVIEEDVTGMNGSWNMLSAVAMRITPLLHNLLECLRGVHNVVTSLTLIPRLYKSHHTDITGSSPTLKEGSPINSCVTCLSCFSCTTEASPLLSFHQWYSVRQSCWAALGNYGFIVCRRGPEVFQVYWTAIILLKCACYTLSGIFLAFLSWCPNLPRSYWCSFHLLPWDSACQNLLSMNSI